MVVAVYDGAEGGVTMEKKVHAGSVYSVEWSADGTKIATSCADKTVKVCQKHDLAHWTCRACNVCFRCNSVVDPTSWPAVLTRGAIRRVAH
eukprot:scaffold131901_cov31-Tisochrysis_lutea.AAC.3